MRGRHIGQMNGKMQVIGNTGVLEHKLTASLALWPDVHNARYELINHTENATFLLKTPNGDKVILRVHRPGYNSALAIQSELAWAKALREDQAIQTPVALPGTDGELVQSAALNVDDVPQYMVLFKFEAGAEPQPKEDLAVHFVKLGKLAAKAHNHTLNWKQPKPFERFVWTADAILNPNGLWGDWRMAPGMSASYQQTFDQLDHLLRKRLKMFGTQTDRYGLIHADMRLANLLVNGDQIKLIDFDDCGFCWFLYDFAASISFIEDSPHVPALKKAWLSGYRSVRDLPDKDEAEMDTFIMLRRMALTAWIGSHAETPFAQSLAGDFVADGAVLAQNYIARFGHGI